MELIRGMCTICNNSVYKTLQNSADIVNVIPLVFKDEDFNESHFQNLKHHLKICPICYYKLDFIQRTTNALETQAENGLEGSSQSCILCKKKEKLFTCEHEWKVFVERLIPYCKVGHGFKFNLCSQCLYFIDVSFNIKSSLCKKYPQLKVVSMNSRRQEKNREFLASPTGKNDVRISPKTSIRNQEFNGGDGTVDGNNSTPKRKPQFKYRENKKSKPLITTIKITNMDNKPQYYIRDASLDNSPSTLRKSGDSNFIESEGHIIYNSIPPKLRTPQKDEYTLPNIILEDKKIFDLVPYVAIPTTEPLITQNHIKNTSAVDIEQKTINTTPVKIQHKTPVKSAMKKTEPTPEDEIKKRSHQKFQSIKIKFKSGPCKPLKKKKRVRFADEIMKLNATLSKHGITKEVIVHLKQLNLKENETIKSIKKPLKNKGDKSENDSITHSKSEAITTQVNQLEDFNNKLNSEPNRHRDTDTVNDLESKLTRNEENKSNQENIQLEEADCQTEVNCEKSTNDESDLQDENKIGQKEVAVSQVEEPTVQSEITPTAVDRAQTAVDITQTAVDRTRTAVDVDPKVQESDTNVQQDNSHLNEGGNASENEENHTAQDEISSTENTTNEDSVAEQKTEIENNSTEQDGTEDDSTEKDCTEDKSTEKGCTEDNSTEKDRIENNSTEKGCTESNSTERNCTENNSTESEPELNFGRLVDEVKKCLEPKNALNESEEGDVLTLHVENEEMCLNDDDDALSCLSAIESDLNSDYFDNVNKNKGISKKRKASNECEEYTKKTVDGF